MTDIVERLREYEHPDEVIVCRMREAANEIERLQAGEKFHRVAVIERDAERKVNAQLGIEIERLRVLLRTANAYGSGENEARLNAEAERDALLEDAERYRWLRDRANYARKHDPLCVTGIGPEATMLDGIELNAAIDAARKGEK
jgi:hypothetical protein